MPNASDSTWTVREVLRWAAEDFAKRNLDSPRLEAEVLLCHVLETDRVRLVIDSARPLEPRELKDYRACIAQRRQGAPVSYIVGYREFFGRRFFVDERVLVPRPDSEMLVEEALERTAHRTLDGRALDLCTGSGCIALSFALRRPTWRVTASDVSEAALEVARRNALHLGSIWNVRLRPGDLFAALSPGERFELITANPPYIERAEMEQLEPQVRDFEPRLALDGGPDGLDFYRRIVEQAPAWLVPGGVLAVEVGAGQAAAVEALLEERGFFDLQRRRDYGGHERVASGRRALK